MTAAPEFSRLEPLDRIGRSDKPVQIEATEAERQALAHRFGLLALERLWAEYVLMREGEGVVANGRIEAAFVQSCVASGAPVPERLSESFTLRFEREPASGTPEEEIELREEDCDIVFFTGERIDMGEAVAETLALSMNPYPRAPDADRLLREAGVMTEEEASPFARLREMTKKG